MRGTGSTCAFLLTPLREGRRSYRSGECGGAGNFYSRPCGRGDQGRRRYAARRRHFYSRPCGRGDFHAVLLSRADQISTHAPAGGATLAAEDGYDGQHISTHAPAGGATCVRAFSFCGNRIISTHAPAGGATRQQASKRLFSALYFYSRPCGRGDYHDVRFSKKAARFLLTPLREGRRRSAWPDGRVCTFLLTPLREGRRQALAKRRHPPGFLLTPLREGRPAHGLTLDAPSPDFYSRPCGRGDKTFGASKMSVSSISTHAPAGGATAIFHKSVMRFCGKLPKDDTVLCLASFGFPRRDPKAVYLAWISCANLPQKCVRQGLALKDQGTSCFHEGLASHAFDPVLV